MHLKSYQNTNTFTTSELPPLLSHSPIVLMSSSSSLLTDPKPAFLHNDYILDPDLWLCLNKFKYHLRSLSEPQIDWKDFPVTHDDQSNMNAVYNLIEIRRAQELTSANTENLLNSILLGLIA